MTKKEYIIQSIKDLQPDLGVIFTETLDDTRRNERTIQGNRENLIKILQDNFNDDLYGHFGDNVMTTIDVMGVYQITTTQV
jgi:hypothetical protein